MSSYLHSILPKLISFLFTLSKLSKILHTAYAPSSLVIHDTKLSFFTV